MNTVEFTTSKVVRLRKAYKEAVAAKLDTFMFDGAEYLTAYAKYLPEYLESRLRK